jgi:lysozyme
MDILADRIKRHEGFRDHIYLDSEGFVTGGYGHHFYPGSRLPVDVAEVLFKMDLALAVSEYSKIAPSTRKKLNTIRARVIVEMIFNMGSKIKQFVKMWKAIENEDFELAANEMLASKWSTQVGQRAVELAEIMRTGQEAV